MQHTLSWTLLLQGLPSRDIIKMQEESAAFLKQVGIHPA